ncbi:hypothetical protein DYD21_06225 [Rhodohalobacter sp. SW132]|uniref:hypothetical protein n=1 Tax=Rhodohalobacter sp. SW132 TaxID=2293433 RepID=UPI000E273F72|nr:hypothetical protein [Rhodohalobacter sp. SW132]REL38202.1 hypothetical protein DYD21_06225 [Rhodohalobacter sp. SW132]
MKSTLNVSEKYSRHWPAIAVGSIIASILFFGAYVAVSDVLIGSYLRLAAFAFFVIGFLSFFKIKDGRIEIQFEVNQKNSNELDVEYSVRGREIHAELIELDDIKDIKTDRMPNRSLYNDLNRTDRSVRFQKKNMEGWLYLNEIHGRVIPLSEDNANKIVAFILSLRPDLN